METSLAALKRDGLLHQWSDQLILPGQEISSEVREKMEQADIIAFIFSPDFIDSEECMKEWTFAQTLATRGKPLFRIPIIARNCAWQDILKGDGVKALPIDGKPVASYMDADLAWHEVYEGLKSVVAQLGSTFSPKLDFSKEIERTDFISQDHLNLQDLFVFLRLTTVDSKGLDQSQQDKTISNLKQLLSTKRALVFGQEKTGKTALARHIYLTLVQEGKPACSWTALLLPTGCVSTWVTRGTCKGWSHTHCARLAAAMLCYMPARPAPPNVLPIELAAFRRLRSQGRRSFRSTPTSCCRRAARVERSGQPNKLAWRAWPHGVAQTVA